MYPMGARKLQAMPTKGHRQLAISNGPFRIYHLGEAGGFDPDGRSKTSAGGGGGGGG